MNNKVRILSMSCFWIVKVFQHSQWQLTWSCMDKNHILKKNWPHPPWPYSRDRREWKPIQCLGAILAGNNSYPKDPRWHQNGISDSDCTNFAKGIRTFRHWVSPDKKTVLLIVETDYMRHLLSEVPLVSFGFFLGFKDIGTRREFTQRG